MVKIIYITTAGDIVKGARTLNRIKKRLPEMTRKGMRRWGKILVRDMKVSARRAGIRDFSRTLLTTGIRWDQGKKSDHGELFMRLHGVYLDSMAPHFVSVTRRRSRLLAWAKLARSSSISRKARRLEKGEIRRFSIFVRPHPFIANGYRRARPKLRSILKQEASKAIQAS